MDKKPDAKSEKMKKQLEALENLDISGLSDEDLESVAGGAQDGFEGDCNSVWCCSNGTG